MKKIDLHIHTIANDYLDPPFTYNSEFMKEYVVNNNFDLIAITNHNLFQRKNYLEVKKDLENIDVSILPGIEISLECGHILVIGDDTEQTYNLLENITNHITGYEKSDKYKMNIAEFNMLCSNKNLILIPHYLKKPELNEDILNQINDDIKIGEVDSPKHFFSLKKSNKKTPVYFSDIRIGLSDKKDYYLSKSRFTYINCDEIDFHTIKRTLSESRYVDLSIDRLDDEFDILNGRARASTGVNVLIGNRSTGKTFTLDHICEANSKSTLYLKQFEITTECKSEVFLEKLKNNEQNLILDYTSELIKVLNYIDLLNVNELDVKLNTYVTSLKENAKQKISDYYSKLSLFNYIAILKNDTGEIKNIIKSLETLLDASNHYKKDIEMFLDRSKLIDLYLLMIKQYKGIYKNNIFIDYANKITNAISELLGIKSVVVQVKYTDLSAIFEARYTRYKFNKLIKNMENKEILCEDMLSKFKKIVRIYKQTNKSTLKSILGVGKQEKIDYLIELEPFDAYIESINDDNIKNGTGDYRYRLFIDYEVVVKNINNQNLSGGQKAEFILLNKLYNYQSYDIVLIDEMEASFDNPFLNKEIVELIKTISKKCIVFISTHNNNLGVSLNPDYYIYHEYNNVDGKDEFLHYCGKSNGVHLINEKQEKIDLNSVLISTMEASEAAYKERNIKYENTKN